MSYDIITTNDPNFVPNTMACGSFMGNSPDCIAPGLINPWSTLSIPGYRRMVDFLQFNLASFPRSVRLAGAQIEEPHPLDPILKRRPNQYQTATEFWGKWFFDAVHHNNGYASIERGPDGVSVAALHNLDPWAVTPFRVIVLQTDPETGEALPPRPEDIEQWYYDACYRRVIPAADVLHLFGLSYDGLMGVCPAYLHRDAFRRAKLYDRYISKFAQKGTRVSGWVEIPREASKEQQEQVIEVMRKYKGSNSTDDIPVLTGGAKLHNDTISPEQSQLLEQEKAVTKLLGQITGVAPEMAFETSDAKYNNNVEAMGDYAVRFTFRLWIEKAEDQMTTKLLSADDQQAGRTVHINPDAILRGNTQEQSSIAVAQTGGPVRTPNEGRALIGLPKTDDPADDKLRTPVGGTPKPETTPAPEPTQHSAAPPVDVFAALRPLLADATARVETKSEKAFAAAKTKKDQERVMWGNILADQQAGYVRESFAAVATVMQTMTGRTIDVDALANKYALEIRRRASGHEAKALAAYVGEMIDGTDDVRE